MNQKYFVFFTSITDNMILIKKIKLGRTLYPTAEIITMTWSPSPTWLSWGWSRKKPRRHQLGLSGWVCLTDMWFWICEEMISYKSRTSEGWMSDCDVSGAMETKGQHRWFQRNDTEELNFICFKNGTWWLVCVYIELYLVQRTPKHFTLHSVIDPFTHWWW